MWKKGQKTGTFLLLVAIIVALSACGNATGTNNRSPAVSEGPSVDTSEYYDYVLRSGGGYQIVAKMEETVTSVIEYVGVLDADYNWVVPLEDDTPLNPRGSLLWFPYSYHDYESRAEGLGSRLRYAGENIFIASLSTETYLFDVLKNKWTSIDAFTAPIATFTDGYMVAADVEHYADKGEYVIIINSNSEARKTNIYCGQPKFVGRYSEGLFFSYDGFYDIEGNRVINLSKYAGLIINQPYFNNGTCKLEAKNENGTLFVAEIDTKGNYISDFTKKE